jgi:hypothetical protein
MEPKSEVVISAQPSPPDSASDIPPPGNGNAGDASTPAAKDYKAEMVTLMETNKIKQESANGAPMEGLLIILSRIRFYLNNFNFFVRKVLVRFEYHAFYVRNRSLCLNF